MSHSYLKMSAVWMTSFSFCVSSTRMVISIRSLWWWCFLDVDDVLLCHFDGGECSNEFGVSHVDSESDDSDDDHSFL